ncbi:hypothetical protein ACIBEJ_38930 [Nonomuraea sp. NPDC050790]|uniref:hypothetical protein n=1 Tax=Nonomuraea sp. NPDC050790 TaxID=3364371 RepID=UPI0037AAC73A
MSEPVPSVPIDELTTYLRLTSWAPTMSGSIAQLWSHPQFEEETLLVPLRSTASDYGKRMRILIQQLAQLERRDPQDIASEISLIYYDVTQLRADHPQLIDDSIPLDAGYQLFESARKIVISAAAATIRRQGHFGQSVPLKAREHARHVRLGQTRRGSYILPVISPARPAPPPLVDEQLHLDVNVEETLFDRRVMTTMARALKTLEEMVSRDRLPSSSEIADSVGEGVSRELCTALDSILSSTEISEIDFEFNWSRVSQPMGPEVALLTFPKESSAVVEHVADKLKTIRREREHVLFGVITDLHRGADEESRGGRIGVETIIERRRRVVWMELGEEAYQEAVRYHGSRTRIVLRGVLRMGRPATMDVSHFEPDYSLSEPSLLANPAD